MNNTVDTRNGRPQNRRTNSMSFNITGRTFHFRRTISKVPSFMDRKKLSRQLSIRDNVEHIRRQSSTANVVTWRIWMCQIVDVNKDATIPWSCQGSIKYVHTSCLEEWIKQSGAIEWEICHEMYSEDWVQWAIDNNYVKKEGQEENESDEDVIDVYCDKLKYFFIFVVLVFILYFVIFFITKESIPQKPYNDMVFLVWRLFVLFLISSIIGLYFFWVKILKIDYQKRFTISLIIRQKLSDVNGYGLLEEIEENWGDINKYMKELKKRPPPVNPPVGQNLVDFVPQS